MIDLLAVFSMIFLNVFSTEKSLSTSAAEAIFAVPMKGTFLKDQKRK